MLKKTLIHGNPMVGVFAAATEKAVFLPGDVGSECIRIFAETMDVEVCGVFIDGSPLIGSLIVANSRGIMVPFFALDEDVDLLSSWGRVERTSETLNALGNNILINEDAALVHPRIGEETVDMLKEVLGVRVEKGTIGGIETVGSAGVVTSRGILCHPRISDEEKKTLEELFGLPVYIGTVNYGSYLVGAGMIANSRGGVVGEPTTGVELNRIEDALDLIKHP